MALADEGIYEYLQISIQKYLNDTRKTHEEVLRCLDSLGFRVGYQLIEKSHFFLISHVLKYVFLILAY
jgi:hypothetical protein